MSVQDTNRELIKVNRDIHKSKIVNFVLDILHIVGNSLITLLRAGKILAMDHDPSARMSLFESSPYSPRCGGGRDNCTRVAYTDPIIALRRNWYCRS